MRPGGGKMYFHVEEMVPRLCANDKPLASLPRHGKGAVHGAGVRGEGQQESGGCIVRA